MKLNDIHCTSTLASMALVINIAACGGVDDSLTDPEPATDESVGDPIIGGIIPTGARVRRGIGIWSMGPAGPNCTASLIDDDWILLAGHCFGYLDTIDNSRTVNLQWRGSTTASGWAGNGAGGVGCPATQDPSHPCFETQRALMLGKYAQIASNARPSEDVYIARLSGNVPSTFAPLPIATSVATAGTVTYWGASDSNTGCSTGFGTMRYREVTLPSAPLYGCGGDSGGPRTVGNVAAAGAIDGVTSNGVLPSTVPPHRAEITDIISAWNSAGANDISVWSGGAFCTHPSSRLFYGDVDGNGEVDAICHDYATGTRWIAASHGRLIQPAWASNVPFCSSSSGSDVVVGDFNADGRTDILCHPKTTGLLTIDYADSTGSFHTSGWWSRPGVSWCTGTWDRLLAGDVTGDGRTDLICHNMSSGEVSWMDALVTGNFDGMPYGTTASGVCNRPNDYLYVGEFDGVDSDGLSPRPRSDLLCMHADGTFWMERSRSPFGPYAGIPDVDFTSGRATGRTCMTSADCTTQWGQTCDAGVCVEHLCSTSNADLTVADVTGDGLTDLLCTYYDPNDGDGNRRNDAVIYSSGIRTYGGVSDHGGIFTVPFSWGVGSASSFPFQTTLGVRIRSVAPATQPVTPPRNGIRAITTR